MMSLTISASSVLSSLVGSTLTVDAPTTWAVPTADHLYHVREWWQYHVRDRSSSSDVPDVMWENALSDALSGAGYPVLSRGHGSTIIRDVPNLPKPSKIVRKYFHELRSVMAPHYATRPFDRTAASYICGPDAVMSGEAEKSVQSRITKSVVSGCILHFSRRWISEDGIYGDLGSCYYPGRDYGHCPDAIVDNGGLVVRVIHPDGASLCTGSYVDDIAIDEAGYGIGRCWIMPVDNYDGFVVCNAYSKSGQGWFNREIVANRLGQYIHEKYGASWHVCKQDCGDVSGWYINGSSGFVVSPDADHRRGDFDLVEADEAKTACACCGDGFDDDELTTVADGDLVCESCLSDSYFHCEVCEEYHPTDDMNTVHDWSDGCERIVCQSCVNNDCDIQSLPDWLSRSGAYYVDMSR